MSAKKKAHREKNKPYNVKHISSAKGAPAMKTSAQGSSINTSATADSTASEDTGVAAENSQINQAIESSNEAVAATTSQAPQPVHDRFWRGVFNGVGLTLIIIAIPVMFGLNLSANQNESLYQSKVEIVQLQISQLNTEAQLLETQLSTIASNQATIINLIEEKKVELSTLTAETNTLLSQLHRNERIVKNLDIQLKSINQQSGKPFFAENLPDAPVLKNPFN